MGVCRATTPPLGSSIINFPQPWKKFTKHCSVLVVPNNESEHSMNEFTKPKWADSGPNTLSYLAECGAPDSIDSAGSLFLLHVRDSLLEHLGYCDCVGDHNDAITEIADGAPDVHTHKRWQEFVDLCAYGEDLSEFGVASNTTEMAGWALYQIANRLCWGLLQQADPILGDASCSRSSSSRGSQ